MFDKNYPDLTNELVHYVAFALSGLPLDKWQKQSPEELRAWHVKTHRVLRAERDYLAKKQYGTL